MTEADALSHVAGFCVVNDISERDWQFDHGGGQWAKGKGFPNFCPTGPMLVTRDDGVDPGPLEMTLAVNGQTMQAGSTATMIFDVAQIVADLSRYLILEPGDLICTGTPPGVGMGQRPQRFLSEGDVMALNITGLGAQRQTVTRAASLPPI